MNSTHGFPLGKYRWYFLQDDCKDPSVSWRYLNFHLRVQRPGTFCCDDGVCIDSELVCDGDWNCDEKSDENNCQLIVTGEGYKKEQPPKQKVLKKYELENVFTSIRVQKIVDINEIDATLTAVFLISLEWNDHRIKFNFLKKDKTKNTVVDSERKNIWYPRLSFYLLDISEKARYLSTEFHVRRETNGSITTENNTTRLNETYYGESNSFIIKHWIQAKFVCDFDSIKQYPFGEQICSIIYGLRLAEAGLINLKFRNLSDDNLHEIDQYMIKNFSTKRDGCSKFVYIYQKYYFLSFLGSEIKIEILMYRNPRNIFLVTYLPTVLMNIINQAVVYIGSELNQAQDNIRIG